MNVRRPLCLLFAVFAIVGLSRAQDGDGADTASAEIIAEAAPVISPLPVPSVTASDVPNDDGSAILVEWELSPSDSVGGAVVGYRIYRAFADSGVFVVIGNRSARQNSTVNGEEVEPGVDYLYRVDVLAVRTNADGSSDTLAIPSQSSVPVAAVVQWFNTDRLWALIWFVIIAAATIYFIEKAKRGGNIYVRKIGGIDAVDDAIGRATEMGRKVFFVPGIQDMNDVQTIAGIAILGRVGAVAAEYETRLEVPTSRSMVMVTARETLKESYSKAGRPDSFQEDQVYYLTDEQFAYAAAVDGRIVRERPATIFYMGAFFAESLILSETGNAAGAIQIAGTAEPTQLPFFVAACDYTLLGEELFAASAYLSREPRQLGSLKGQDFGKGIFLLAILLGVILATANLIDLSQYFRIN